MKAQTALHTDRRMELNNYLQHHRAEQDLSVQTERIAVNGGLIWNAIILCTCFQSFETNTYIYIYIQTQNDPFS
jgi:hypothetical protein